MPRFTVMGGVSLQRKYAILGKSVQTVTAGSDDPFVRAPLAD